MCLVCIIRGEQAAEARGGQIESKVLDLTDMVWYFAIGTVFNLSIIRDAKNFVSIAARIRFDDQQYHSRTARSQTTFIQAR
jgi:hypothetical protein